MDESQIPIIIDIGSSTIKIGYGGDDKPRLVLSSSIGLPANSESAEEGNIDQSSSEGSSVSENTDNHSKPSPAHKIDPDAFTSTPIYGKNLQKTQKFTKYKFLNFDDPKMLEHAAWLVKDILTTKLCVDLKTHPFIFSEPNLKKPHFRAFFKNLASDLDIPKLFVARKSLLTLFSCGKTSGAVLDSGSRLTSVSPIEEGWFASSGYSESLFGGHELTNLISQELPISCVLGDKRVGLEGALEDYDPSLFDYRKYLIAEELKIGRFRHNPISVNLENLELSVGSTEAWIDKYEPFQLPDGSEFKISVDLQNKCESLFSTNKQYKTIKEMLAESLACLNENMIDSSIYDNIIMSGGNSKAENFTENLKNTIIPFARSNGLKTKIFTFPNPELREMSTWIGGSILSSLDDIEEFYVTKKDLMESGDQIFDQRFP